MQFKEKRNKSFTNNPLFVKDAQCEVCLMYNYF